MRRPCCASCLAVASWRGFVIPTSPTLYSPLVHLLQQAFTRSMFFLPEAGSASAHNFTLADELSVEFATVKGEEYVEIDACDPVSKLSHAAKCNRENRLGTYDKMFPVVCPYARNLSPNSYGIGRMSGLQLL